MLEQIVPTDKTEAHFNPENLDDILTNPHFHHSLKGCICELVCFRASKSFSRLAKICHTHDIECSKTGWELGWYKGVNLQKFDATRTWTKCSVCGRKFQNSNDYNLDMCPYCFKRKATPEQVVALNTYRRIRENERSRAKWLAIPLEERIMINKRARDKRRLCLYGRQYEHRRS